MTKRKVFNREFKLEAIRLLDAGQKKVTDFARDLGVTLSRLYKWRDQLQRKRRNHGLALKCIERIDAATGR